MARCTTGGCPRTSTRVVYWGPPPSDGIDPDKVVVNHPYCDEHAGRLDRPGINVVPPLHDAAVYDFERERALRRPTARRNTSGA